MYHPLYNEVCFYIHIIGSVFVMTSFFNFYYGCIAVAFLCSCSLCGMAEDNGAGVGQLR